MFPSASVNSPINFNTLFFLALPYRYVALDRRNAHYFPDGVLNRRERQRHVDGLAFLSKRTVSYQLIVSPRFILSHNCGNSSGR